MIVVNKFNSLRSALWGTAASTTSNYDGRERDDQQVKPTTYRREENSGNSMSISEMAEPVKGTMRSSSENAASRGHTANVEGGSPAIREGHSLTHGAVAQDSPHGRKLNSGDTNKGDDRHMRRKRESDYPGWRVKVLQDEKAAMQRANEELKKDNEQWKKDNEQLRKEKERREKELRESEWRLSEVQRILEALKNEHVGLTKELKSTQDREVELRSYNDRQTKEISIIKGELRRAEAQHSARQRLLEERTSELKGAELFINFGDTLSGADVIRMAEALNAEILQSAAFMADSVEYFHCAEQNVANVVAASRCSAASLGEAILDALHVGRGKREDEFDPTIVQVALQTCMVDCCSKLICSWTAEGSDTLLFQKIYRKIYHEETQAVAGRWRSMTRASIDSKAVINVHIGTMVDALTKILVVAGCSKHDVSPSGFSQRFQERLSIINDLTMRLQTAVGKEITSTDIHPWVFRPGDTFDSGIMDNTFGEERTSDGQRAAKQIAGTTELGLFKETRDAEGTHADILLKPKVVLCSALLEELK